MISGIIVTRGNLGQELIDTAELIMGKIDKVSSISNVDLSLDGLIQKIEDSIVFNSDRDIFLMSDMKGGSAYIASRKTARRHSNVFFISGINIPMLISFISKRELYGPEELLNILVDDTIRGMDAVSPGKR